MKNKLIYLSICLSLWLASLGGCKDSSEVVEPYLELGQDTLVCNQTASVQSITVKCNQEWTARVTNGATWCIAHPMEKKTPRQ